MGGVDGSGWNLPAVPKLISYVLEIGIPHVLNAKDKDVLVFINTLLYLLIELFVVFSAGLFLGLGEGDDLVALAAGHC